ncbi:T9SS type A sorting domain-containing protein [Candidatus Poribacteria bacterium]|nr:T9SS type A sorting domain-containing protein [Candidatus Poribacteria bacterium]
MNNRFLLIIYILIIIICLHSTVIAELPFKLWRGHPDRVLAVAFSPDGNLLASAGVGENKIRLWDVQRGTQISVLEGHDSVVTSVAFNKNGILASASEDETIKLWNVDNGKELRRLLGHSGQISSIAFSPDGKWLASGANDQLVKIWDTETGMERATFEGHSDAIFSVAFSPDGKLIASGSADGTIRLWDVATKQELSVYRGHEYYVWSIAFSPDGSKLVSGSWDKTVRVWDLLAGKDSTTGAVLATFDAYVLSVDCSPGGKLIAVGILDPGYGNTVSIWDIKTGSQIRTFDVKSKYDMAFSPDGTKLATVGSSNGEIRVWESRTDVPKLLSPENDTIVSDQMVILKWAEVTGAVYYEVEVAQDSDFTIIELSPTIVADKQFPLELWPEGSHWWRVRTGGFGQVGDWSQPLYFTVAKPSRQCVVKVDPEMQVINKTFAEESTVSVKIENVTELAGFQLELAFDPNILEILNLRKVGEIFGEDRAILDPYPMPPPGLPIFGEDGTTLTPKIDNVNGLISSVIATKVSPGGVSGSGLLLEVHFKTKVSGESKLKLQNVVLVNASQEKISDCQIISGSVIVVNPSKPWDVNQDGEVNVPDLVAVLQHLGERVTEPMNPNPDVNGDGIVDDVDVYLVKSHFGEKYDITQITTSPPPPPSVVTSPTPPPPPGSPKIETRFLEENGFLTTLVSFDLPLLKKIYEFVNQNVEINPELIPLKETLYVLIQSANQKLPPQNRLAQNYPNPFNPETWIPYQLAQGADVTITIFEASGRIIRTLDVGYQPAGSYVSKDRAAYWEGKNNLGETVVSGIYFYSIRAGNFNAVKKMIVAK